MERVRQSALPLSFLRHAGLFFDSICHSIMRGSVICEFCLINTTVTSKHPDMMAEDPANDDQVLAVDARSIESCACGRV
jgi:hypothetical protein